jgi:flagellar P-ring protein precursor FlgI
LQTPLKAGNGQVYAVGQGAVSIGGFAVAGGGNKVQKNFLTVGLSPNGGIVERSVEDTLGSDGKIALSLSTADFTTASRIVRTINASYGQVARAANSGRIDITIPYGYRNDVVSFIANIEDLPVTPDNRAKVVVNERTGTVVIGGEVAVDEAAIAQGGLNISIVKNSDVNQPPPFSMGETVETRTTDVNAKDEAAHTIVLPATTNVNDIVGALNSIGATPRDVISILQALKASGALHADLEII